MLQIQLVACATLAAQPFWAPAHTVTGREPNVFLRDGYVLHILFLFLRHAAFLLSFTLPVLNSSSHNRTAGTRIWRGRLPHCLTRLLRPSPFSRCGMVASVSLFLRFFLFCTTLLPPLTDFRRLTLSFTPSFTSQFPSSSHDSMFTFGAYGWLMLFVVGRHCTWAHGEYECLPANI